MKPAVFLDRDGTLNEDVGCFDRLERLVLFPWSVDAVRLLNGAGFCVVVLTNQQCVATGVISEAFVNKVHGVLDDRFRRGGARVERFYYCPHDPHAPIEKYRRDCMCRKPKSGMVQRAVDDLDIDLARSFVVGDKWSEVVLARSVGAIGILLQTDCEVMQAKHPGRPRDTIMAADLMAATVQILGRRHA